MTRHSVLTKFVLAQLTAVLADIPVAGIKIGVERADDPSCR
jgi:hydroxymethylpyrimidine/phosphomethylpyrimidine kinase